MEISEGLTALEFLDICEGRSKRLENIHLASAATGEAYEFIKIYVHELARSRIHQDARPPLIIARL